MLRERIARHYFDTYGIRLPAERIVVTQGSSGAFLLSFLSSFEPGDRVALAAPGYPAYRNISALGFEPVDSLADSQHKFQPTVELLRDAGKVEGSILASPSNSTGTTVSESEMRELAHYCDVNGIRLISDEIYHGIFDGATVTAAAHSDSAIVINSFSKYFSMTGWRLGWMVVPPDMLRAIECLAQNLFHLGAGAVAACRHSCLRLQGRARRPCAPLS